MNSPSPELERYWLTTNPMAFPDWHFGLGAPSWVSRFLRTLVCELNGINTQEHELPSSVRDALIRDIPVDVPSYAVATNLMQLLHEEQASGESGAKGMAESARKGDGISFASQLVLINMISAALRPDMIAPVESRVPSTSELMKVVTKHEESSSVEELAELEAALNAIDWKALRTSLRIIRAAPVPLWGIPAAFEEYLWFTNSNDDLLKVSRLVFDFHQERESLVASSVDLASWDRLTFDLMAALHPILMGPVSVLVSRYRSQEPNVQAELFRRFGVLETQDIASRAGEADECWANISASTLNILTEEEGVHDSLSRVISRSVRKDGKFRTRVVLRDLFFHRLVMPRSWFDELEYRIKDQAHKCEEQTGTLREVSLVNHVTHEIAHAAVSAWCGYALPKDEIGSISPVVPVGLQLPPGTISLAVNFGTNEFAAGHVAGSFTREKDKANDRSFSEILELVEYLVVSLMDSMHGGEVDSASATLKEVDHLCCRLIATEEELSDRMWFGKVIGVMWYVSSALLVAGQAHIAYGWLERLAGLIEQKVRDTGDFKLELQRVFVLLRHMSCTLRKKTNEAGYGKRLAKLLSPDL